MPKFKAPMCGVCGWEISAWGQCSRLELHWSVCPDCKSARDFARRCKCGSSVGRGVAAVERLVWHGYFRLVPV